MPFPKTPDCQTAQITPEEAQSYTLKQMVEIMEASGGAQLRLAGIDKRGQQNMLVLITTDPQMIAALNLVLEKIDAMEANGPLIPQNGKKETLH